MTESEAKDLGLFRDWLIESKAAGSMRFHGTRAAMLDKLKANGLEGTTFTVYALSKPERLSLRTSIEVVETAEKTTAAE